MLTKLEILDRANRLLGLNVEANKALEEVEMLKKMMKEIEEKANEGNVDD